MKGNCGRCHLSRANNKASTDCNPMLSSSRRRSLSDQLQQTALQQHHQRDLTTTTTTTPSADNIRQMPWATTDLHLQQYHQVLTIQPFFNTRHHFKKKSRSCCCLGHVMSTTIKICLLLCLLNNVTAVAGGYTTCYRYLAAADANSDNILTPAEYTLAVAYLSNYLVDVAQFSELSEQLQGGYTFRATSDATELDITGVRQTDASTETVDLLCTSLYSGLAESLGITTSQQQCFIGMALGDVNRDNFLQKEPEFVRFANQLSGSNAYSVTTAFDELPFTVQQVFNDFSDPTTDLVNVDGSKPGTTPTEEQQAILSNLCRQITVAIVAGEQPMMDIPGINIDESQTTDESTQPPSATTDSPAEPAPDSPVDGSPFTPSFTIQICTTSMIVSDLNRDDQLNEEEYIRFINRLTGNQYVSNTFDTLPAPLIDNYILLAAGNGGEISVAGSKPGTTPTEEQTIALENICTSTDKALQSSSGDDTGGDSDNNVATDGPQKPSTLVPTTDTDELGETPSNEVEEIPYVQCTIGMVTSDTDRSGSLNEAEYLDFLNKVTGNAYSTLAYDELPDPIKSVYNEMSVDGEIDIAGARPGQTASDDQRLHLEKICYDTAVAIATPVDVAPETLVPTPVVTDLIIDESEGDTDNNTTTVKPNPVKNETDVDTTVDAVSDTFPVYNSFIISNTGGLNANNIEASAEYAGLVTGYSKFVETSVAAWKQRLAENQASTQTSGMSKEEANNVDDLNSNVETGDGSSGANSTSTNSEKAARRRNLVVNELVSASVALYEITDTLCPASVTATVSLCQTIYSTFGVSYENETDLDDLSEELSEFTQNRIDDVEGDIGLQFFVITANPDSSVTIVEPSLPLRPYIDDSDPSRNDADNSKDDGSLSIGILVGSAAGGLVLIAVIGYFFAKKCGLGCSCKCLSCCHFLRKKKESKDTNNHDNSQGDVEEGDGKYMGSGFGQFSPEQPVGSPKTRMQGLFGSNSNRTPSSRSNDEESGGFSVQEQDNESRSGLDSHEGDDPDEYRDRATSGNVFSSFGKIGKKKGAAKSGSPSTNLQADGNDDNTADDFVDYTFDNPTSVLDQSSTGFFPDSSNNWNASASADNFGTNAWGEHPPAFDAGPPGSVSGSSRSGSDDRSEAEELSGSFEEDNEDEVDEEDDESSESDTYYGEDDHTKATRESYRGGQKVPDNMRHLDSMVENGDWDGVMAAAAQFGTQDERLSDAPSESSKHLDEASDDHSETESRESNYDDASNSQEGLTNVSLNSEDRLRRAQYREKVEALVRKVVPDEMDNVSAMMDQFAGREAELLNTLQTMYQRSSSQRARKAVHKSKAMQKDSSRFSSGGTDGPAAIAAASTIGGGDARNSPKFENDHMFGTGSSQGSGSDQFGEFGIDSRDESRGSEDIDEDSYDTNHNESVRSRDPSFGMESANQSPSFADGDEEGEVYSDEGSYSQEGSYDDEGVGHDNLNYEDDKEGSYSDEEGGDSRDDPVRRQFDDDDVGSDSEYSDDYDD